MHNSIKISPFSFIHRASDLPITPFTFKFQPCPQLPENFVSMHSSISPYSLFLFLFLFIPGIYKVFTIPQSSLYLVLHTLYLSLISLAYLPIRTLIDITLSSLPFHLCFIQISHVQLTFFKLNHHLVPLFIFPTSFYIYAPAP